MGGWAAGGDGFENEAAGNNEEEVGAKVEEEEVAGNNEKEVGARDERGLNSASSALCREWYASLAAGDGFSARFRIDASAVCRSPFLSI
jgi:hypothetical protein